MDVSENNGTPKSSILKGIFHYKPSILGYHYFWKHPYGCPYDLCFPPQAFKPFEGAGQPLVADPVDRSAARAAAAEAAMRRAGQAGDLMKGEATAVSFLLLMLRFR